MDYKYCICHDNWIWDTKEFLCNLFNNKDIKYYFIALEGAVNNKPLLNLMWSLCKLFLVKFRLLIHFLR